MKKVILSIGIIFVFSACDFESRADFEKQLATTETNQVDIDMPTISYEADKAQVVEQKADRNEDDENFIEMYGRGKIGRAIDPSTSIGNLIDADVGQTQIGISLIQSVQYPDAYSTVLTYNRDNNLTEREFGPLAGSDTLSTTVCYDIVESESGPILAVSQVSVMENETYSAYYLFNKFMGLMDYVVIRSSVDQVMPTVERLGDVVEWTETYQSGSLDQAIDNRIEAEKRYLPDILGPYGIKTRPLTSYIINKEMDVGYIPDIRSEDRILLAKTNDNPNKTGLLIDIEK